MTGPAARRTFPRVAQAPLNDIDLVALSDAAWQVIDADGDHEAEEEVWTAMLHTGWPPFATLDQMRAHLDEIVAAVSPPAPAVPLRAVAALMLYLAAHPEQRTPEEALLPAALREACGATLPEDVAAWLEGRRRAFGPHARGHGARQPRRTDARPIRDEAGA